MRSVKQQRRNPEKKEALRRKTQTGKCIKVDRKTDMMKLFSVREDLKKEGKSFS